MMKSRFFPKKDEVVLSAFTALVVVGLVWQGCASLTYTRENGIFQKTPVTITSKK